MTYDWEHFKKLNKSDISKVRIGNGEQFDVTYIYSKYGWRSITIDESRPSYMTLLWPPFIFSLRINVNYTPFNTFFINIKKMIKKYKLLF